jgi:ABC-type multidrug transport system fused ATPase/permease subunit
MVLQDVFLFHGTIRENILFGRPDATEEELIRAAEIANASEFIDRMPNGYDTLIGERGVKLSGGQKQTSFHRPGSLEKQPHPDPG